MKRGKVNSGDSNWMEILQNPLVGGCWGHHQKTTYKVKTMDVSKSNVPAYGWVCKYVYGINVKQKQHKMEFNYTSCCIVYRV
jgi:hypothetical protein